MNWSAIHIFKKYFRKLSKVILKCPWESGSTSVENLSQLGSTSLGWSVGNRRPISKSIESLHALPLKRGCNTARNILLSKPRQCHRELGQPKKTSHCNAFQFLLECELVKEEEEILPPSIERKILFLLETIK